MKKDKNNKTEIRTSRKKNHNKHTWKTKKKVSLLNYFLLQLYLNDFLIEITATTMYSIYYNNRQCQERKNSFDSNQQRYI